MNPGTSALKPDVATYHLTAAAQYSDGPPQSTILTSWKDIARYMGKGVRTVQRWEQDFGLPVRRPLGSTKKAVLARPRDLDAWVALRCSSRAEPLTDVERLALRSEIVALRQQLSVATRRLQMLLGAQSVAADALESDHGEISLEEPGSAQPALFLPAGEPVESMKKR
jgi:hypothetical protein